MTSDQSCPLCGEKLYWEPHIKKVWIHYGALRRCSFDSVNKFDLQLLSSQIARIRQEAKQELMNEFDAEFEVMENEATDEENYCIVTYAYDRIKKKHGVE